VIGEPHHGYVLACEVRRGGVQIDWEEDSVGVKAFEDALGRMSLGSGLVRITVEGRLGRSATSTQFGVTLDPSVLRISAVRSVEFLPMTEAEVGAVLDRRL
jgi:hypothetical protein